MPVSYTRVDLPRLRFTVCYSAGGDFEALRPLRGRRCLTFSALGREWPRSRGRSSATNAPCSSGGGGKPRRARRSRSPQGAAVFKHWASGEHLDRAPEPPQPVKPRRARRSPRPGPKPKSPQNPPCPPCPPWWVPICPPSVRCLRRLVRIEGNRERGNGGGRRPVKARHLKEATRSHTPIRNRPEFNSIWPLLQYNRSAI